MSLQSSSTIQLIKAQGPPRHRDPNNPMDYTPYHFNLGFDSLGLPMKMIWSRGELLDKKTLVHAAILRGFASLWRHDWDENIIESPIHEQVETREGIGRFSKNWMISMMEEDFIEEMEKDDLINFDTSAGEQ